MVKPIKALHHGQVHATKIVEDDNSVVCVIRAELGEDALLIHPIIYDITKGRLQRFEEALLQFLAELKAEYGYEHWYALTTNTKLVRIMNLAQPKKIADIDGQTLYEGVI
tara:strand:- start:289 stop:618 length:330 start_codon:yes stop_codon:yes gene_type:complete